MKTVHKLILKSYLGPMVLTFFIVMFVLLMQFMWRYIDELVGKGLGMDVIFELMFYASCTLIPMGLPLATLLAAIMTLGNLGENYELLAMKSAGMSLPRILQPVAILIAVVAVSSFFVANNLVPYSTKQIYSLLYDIRQQKQSLEFKDGLFFNGIENMSIRVDHQHPETKLLTGILIYDTRDYSGNMTTTLAESGYIRLSDDKKYLLVTLFNGETYEESRNYQWYDKSALRHHVFNEQNGTIPLAGFSFSHSDQDMSGNSQTKNIAQLEVGIDSLQKIVAASTATSYEPLLKNYIFVKDNILAKDTVTAEQTKKTRVLLEDSIAKLNVYQKKDLWAEAKNTANGSRSYFTFDEATSKDALSQLYRFKVEWHRKMSLPVSIMIFFLIGAPLGAIIRKGGLGMPIVVSVLFFMVYYMISITGEKLAREGSWNSFVGMWISTFVLFPISVFLTYKATNDSNLFNAEWYILRYRAVRDTIVGLLRKTKKSYDS